MQSTVKLLFSTQFSTHATLGKSIRMYEIAGTEILEKNSTKASHELLQAICQNCSVTSTIQITNYSYWISASAVSLNLLAQFKVCFAHTEAKSYHGQLEK